MKVWTALVLALWVAMIVVACGQKKQATVEAPVAAPQVVVSQDKVMVQRVAENLARDRVSIEQTRLANQRDSEARSAMRPAEKPVVAQSPPPVGKVAETPNLTLIANLVAGPIEEVLKNPRDAQWGPPVIEQEGATVTDKETRQVVKVYRVKGWVDATNGFGAWERMKYTGLVREQGGVDCQLVPGSIEFE